MVIVLREYIVFDKFIVDDENNNIEIEDKNSAKDNIQITQNDNQSIQVLYSNVGIFIIDKDGFVYYRKSIDKYVGAEIKMEKYTSIGAYWSFEGKRLYDWYWLWWKYKQNNSHKFDGYKLNLENINSAYEIEIGNGCSSEIIYFLSKDGKVNELQFDSNGQELNVQLSKDTCTKSNIFSVL